MDNIVVFGDSLNFVKSIPERTFPLIYIDPPFNTGKTQQRGEIGYEDVGYREISGYLEYLTPYLEHSHSLLTSNGTLYVHLDYRTVHYVKVFLDSIFGVSGFLNEIIWSYDYGGKSKKRWPTKHDTILVYVKDRNNYVFNSADIDREPYMAPGLAGKDKAALGKLPTDVWWHTIVATNGTEKTGYPTQKPLGVLGRILRASSNPGDMVLDFFAGSGTTGMAAVALGRKFCLVDNNPQAIEIMRKRFSLFPVEYREI